MSQKTMSRNPLLARRKSAREKREDQQNKQVEEGGTHSVGTLGEAREERKEFFFLTLSSKRPHRVPFPPRPPLVKCLNSEGKEKTPWASSKKTAGCLPGRKNQTSPGLTGNTPRRFEQYCVPGSEGREL